MPNKPTPKPQDEKQLKRFVETAKELGADTGGAQFDRLLDVVVPKTVPHKPQKSQLGTPKQ